MNQIELIQQQRAYINVIRLAFIRSDSDWIILPDEFRCKLEAWAPVFKHPVPKKLIQIRRNEFV